MTLDEAIKKYKKENQSLIYPRNANGECASASLFFISFLSRNNVQEAGLAKIVIYNARTARHHPLNPRFLSLREDASYGDENPKRPVGGWIDHAVVKIGRLRIDWTVRQFDRKAPFPLIWRTKR